MYDQNILVHPLAKTGSTQPSHISLQPKFAQYDARKLKQPQNIRING